MIELYLSKVTENSESEQAGKLYARVSYKQAMDIYGYQPLQALQIIDEDSLTDEQLFQHIHDVIVRERLFLDPSFGRQTIIDRFQLSKERVGAIFSKSSEHSKLSGYVQQFRLEYAAKLLIEQPEKSIVQIASDCGFSSHTYFRARFRQHFGLSPSDFRSDVLEQE